MVRFKNRYLLCELEWVGVEKNGEGVVVVDGISNEDLRRGLMHKVQQKFGPYGAALVVKHVDVKYWNNVTRMCLVRTGRANHRVLLECMEEEVHVKKYASSWNVVHVAGSMRCCQMRLYEYNNDLIRRHANEMKEEAENEAAEGEEEEGDGDEEMGDFLSL